MKALFWGLTLLTCVGIAVGVPMLLHFACGMSVGMAIFVTLCGYILGCASFVLVMYLEDIYYSRRKNGVDKGKKM